MAPGARGKVDSSEDRKEIEGKVYWITFWHVTGNHRSPACVPHLQQPSACLSHSDTGSAATVAAGMYLSSAGLKTEPEQNVIETPARHRKEYTDVNENSMIFVALSRGIRVSPLGFFTCWTNCSKIQFVVHCRSCTD